TRKSTMCCRSTCQTRPPCSNCAHHHCCRHNAQPATAVLLRSANTWPPFASHGLVEFLGTTPIIISIKPVLIIKALAKSFNRILYSALLFGVFEIHNTSLLLIGINNPLGCQRL